MGQTKPPKPTSREDIIAAFDREREQAHELRQRHAEQIRNSHRHDRPVYVERRRKPR